MYNRWIRIVFNFRLSTCGVDPSGSVQIGSVFMYIGYAAYKMGRFSCKLEKSGSYVPLFRDCASFSMQKKP
jgi:hypothetical protein